MSTEAYHPDRAAELGAKHPALVRFGQAGWLAKGVVYVLAGVLGLAVVARAAGSTVIRPTQEASPTGAIKQVATLAGGRVLLLALGLGLLIYAAWRVLTAVLPGDADAESVATRLGYLVSAVIYTALALTALSLVRHPADHADGNETVRDLTARMLGVPLGRAIVGAAGVIAVGAGLYRVIKGFRGDVTDELSLAGMSPWRVRWTRRLGIWGEVGRGTAIALIGFFLLRAAIDGNAAEATGLDGALRRLATASWGRIVVVVIAVGFLLYGLLCIDTFQRRKLRTP